MNKVPTKHGSVYFKIDHIVNVMLKLDNLTNVFIEILYFSYKMQFLPIWSDLIDCSEKQNILNWTSLQLLGGRNIL